MTNISKKSILSLGKKGDEHCLRAVDFIKSNFENSEIHLGKWGDSLPEDIGWWEGDYIVSYLSRWIVPPSLLKRAKTAAINFHPASPDYPGIGCYNFALYYEEKVYGVTCHHMLPNVDTGTIIDTKKFPVFPSDTVSTLLSRAYYYQLVLFYEVMEKILKGEELPVSKEKWTRKPITRKEFSKLTEITPDMDNEEVKKRIRATSFNEWQPTVKIGDFSFEYDKKSET